MLDVQKKTGMYITESFAQLDGLESSADFLRHLRRGYCSLGKIARDQVDATTT